MLNRIFVGLAIAAGIFVAAWGFFQLKPRIEGIIEAHNKEKGLKEAEIAAHNTTKKNLKTTEAKLKTTEETLVATTAEKDKFRQQVETQEKTIGGLKEDLKKTTEDRNSAQAELAAWKALGIPVEQIGKLIRDFKDLTVERDAIEQEKKVLNRKVDKLTIRIKDLLGERFVVELPPDLKGKILVVDPKWDFCVVDVGEKQGVKERGELLVNRNGQLVAKLLITSVEADRCVANVVPGWRLQDVVEGDTIFPVTY